MYKLNKQDKEEIAAKRGRYPADMRWYVIMTHAGHEQEVSARIRQALDSGAVAEVLLPEYLGPGTENGLRRISLLFSSYVFLRCAMDDEIYMRVCQWPHVFRILGEAWRIPAPVADAEIGWLKGVLMACERPQMVCPTSVGDDVEVAEGLMKGMRGRVVGGNAKTVKLEARFSFLDPGSAICVVVPRSALKTTISELVGKLS